MAHHAVLPEAMPLRAALEIALREREVRVRGACVIAGVSLVAPALFAVAWPMGATNALLAYVGTVGYLGLGLSAGMQYLAAVRIIDGVDVRDLGVFTFAAFFPLWGPVVFVMSVFAGGPVVCSGIWAGMLAPRIVWRRASRLALIGGGASLGVGVAILFGLLMYGQGMMVRVMLGASAMVWHVVMAVGLVLAGCRGYCERRVDGAECIACGYDLVGLPEAAARCPECGLELLGRDGPSDEAAPLLPSV